MEEKAGMETGHSNSS